MTAILTIWNDCKPGREDDYEAWYREEHLLERLSVPGFRTGRRYAALDASRAFLTTYEVDSADVLTSPDYQSRLDNPTPRTRAIMMDGFENMSRTICNRVDVQGPIRGSFAVAAALHGGDAAGQLQEMAGFCRHQGARLHQEIWLPADSAEKAPAAEEALRGGDAKIAGCFLAEFTFRDEAMDAAAGLMEQFPQVDAGVFQLISTLGKDDLG